MSREQEKTISPSVQGMEPEERPEEGQSVSGVKGVSSRSLSSLSERLQRHSQKESQLIEEVVKDALQKQRRDLKDLITCEQQAIASDIVEQRKYMQRVWKREWLIQLLLGLGLTLGVIVGSWSWTEYQISRLRDAQDELARVQNILAREKPLLSRMEVYSAPHGGIWVRVKSREDWIEAVPLNGVSGTYVEALVKKED